MCKLNMNMLIKKTTKNEPAKSPKGNKRACAYSSLGGPRGPPRILDSHLVNKKPKLNNVFQRFAVLQ